MIASAHKRKREMYDRLKVKCENESGPAKKICQMKAKQRAIQFEIDGLNRAHSRCSYAYKKELCQVRINAEIKEKQTQVKELDKIIKIQQQNIK